MTFEERDQPTVPATYVQLFLELAASHGRRAAIPANRDVLARVRARLNLVDEPPPQLGQVAAELCISGRTLKRKLRRQGTSYQELLDEARQCRCIGLLADSRHSLEEIAEITGYSTAANFARAFRRWCGTTPGQYRARMRDEALRNPEH